MESGGRRDMIIITNLSLFLRLSPRNTPWKPTMSTKTSNNRPIPDHAKTTDPQLQPIKYNSNNCIRCLQNQQARRWSSTISIENLDSSQNEIVSKKVTKHTLAKSPQHYQTQRRSISPVIKVIRMPTKVVTHGRSNYGLRNCKKYGDFGNTQNDAWNSSQADLIDSIK